MGLTEKDIETSILVFLNKIHGCFAWKNQSVGIYDNKKQIFRKSKNPFCINGVSDILGIFNGKLLAIEVKKPGGILSKEQDIFIQKINKIGGISGVCYSVDDAKKLIDSISRVS